MTDEERERAVLAYLSFEEADPKRFYSQTTIFEHFTENRKLRDAFFDHVFEHDDQMEALRVVLDDMTRNGLLESRMDDREYESFYRISDQGTYEAALPGGPLVVGRNELRPGNAQVEDEVQSTIDSANWTGLSRVSVTHRNARAISSLIDTALGELDSLYNASTAQARTLLLAAKALTDAPEPPSDIIWELIQRAGAVVGILDIFLRIFSAALT